MDYAKIGKRLEDRASGPKPSGDNDGDEIDTGGDSLGEAFTPKQAAAIRAYVKACMDAE